MQHQPAVSEPNGDEADDWPSPDMWRSHLSNASTSRHGSPAPRKDSEHSEDVKIHPEINGEFLTFNFALYSFVLGRPCGPNGQYLPNNAPPPLWEQCELKDFTPYDSCASFKLADLLYSHVQMSAGNISELMQIIGEWAWTNFDEEAEPPFANAKDMYETIDATKHGHIPWQLFALSYKTEDLDDAETVAPWMHKTFDVWFRDPQEVLKMQLGNCDFANDMDFAPKEVRDSKTKVQRYRDFMSGCWAWRQVVCYMHLHHLT